MLRVNWYQVYNNGEGDLIVYDDTPERPDRRKNLGRGAIPLDDVTVGSAAELEILRKMLEERHRSADHPEVEVMFNTTLMN